MKSVRQCKGTNKEGLRCRKATQYDEEYCWSHNPSKHTRRIGCVHLYYLSFAGKCDGCRRLPLSGRNYPDHYNRASRRSDEDLF